MGNFPAKCFDLAEKYRVPSMILADGILGQMMEPIEFEAPMVDVAKRKLPDWAIGVNKGRERRMINSYDLLEGELEKAVMNRAKRWREIENKETICQTMMTEDAELLLVAYGTAARSCVAAMRMAREKGIKVGLFRPITLWPFPYQQLRTLATNGKIKNVLTVEMSLGQFMTDVRLAVNGLVPVRLHARPGGMPISGEDVLSAIQSMLAGKSEGLYDDALWDIYGK